MPDNLIGAYTDRPFPTAREVGIDTARIGMARHHIPIVGLAHDLHGPGMGHSAGADPRTAQRTTSKAGARPWQG